MDKNEISQKIHEAWNIISYQLAMESEDGKFKMSDLNYAFHKGADVVLRSLGININE